MRRLFLRPRLGIEVGSRAVRAVLVVRGRIVRVATVRLQDAESLNATLLNVFDSTCRGLWPRPRVFVAVGPSLSQLRRLVNLPAVRSARALREVVRSSAGRFFLKNGVPLLTSSVRREDGAGGWAAALDEPSVRAVAEACRSRRLRLEVAAPTVVGLQHALAGAWLVTEDGGVWVEAHVGSDGTLRDVRRATARSDDGARGVAMPIGALRSLGAGALEYAGAYGATAIERSEPLALHARELRQWREATVPLWRMLVAAVVLLAAVSLALTLPPLRASRVAAHAAARLTKINQPYRAAHWTDAELERTTTALEEIDAFERDRRSLIGFLSELTAGLPNDAWLQSLRLDQHGGTVIALAPRAASALAGVAEVKAIAAPVIVGDVSSEQRGPDRIERITIRFRWRSSDRGSDIPVPSARELRK
jgi:hypothetical protein